MDIDTPIFDKYGPELERIDRELEQGLRSPVALACHMGAHTLLGPGKRLRPLLFCLSCRLSGRVPEDMYRLSTVFEYIHAASLLHDDVLDNADLRRNRPSVNRVWGNHAAVLEGDFLYSKCMAIAVRAGNLGFIRTLADTTLKMTEGQILELLHTHDWHMGRQRYFDIIEAKTASLLSASCSCAAVIVQTGGEVERALAGFGLNMGIAFQMADDLLDYTGDEARLGKPVGKDLGEGKITLPLIYTLAGMTGAERRHFQELLEGNRASPVDHRRLIERVRGNGAIERVRKEARSYLDRASACLRVFPPSEAKESLLEINRYALDRDR